MAKIYSAKAELTVLRGLFHKDRAVVGTLLSSVDESYFYREEAREVFSYIKEAVSEEGAAPKFKLALEDPGLTKDAREYLRDSPDTIQGLDDANKSIKILRKFRKMRGLHEIAHDIDGNLNGSKVDADKMIEAASDRLTELRQTKTLEDTFLHFGKNNNSMDFVRNLIYDEEEDAIIPTGIRAFDDTNLGFMRGSLVIIGGNSGAGKSQMASALAVNMAEMGYRVLLVPLEMSKKEMTARILANICRVDSLKIFGKKLSAEGKDKVMARYKRWVKKTKAKGGRYTIYKPDSDVTITEAYAAISSYDVDVVIIDYISLLAGTDGDDQWKQLGAVARVGKINAELNHRVNILLSQVDDGGKIRYSQTVKEHASNAWVFVADKDSKEQGILKVEQIKSRNQVGYPFTVKIDYAHSTVSDVDQDYQESAGSSAESAVNLADIASD